MFAFKAKLNIIGINPFVFVPEKILAKIFKASGKDKGAIPICGTINNKKYTQTLLRYSGAWRLYINQYMLPGSPKRIGEIIEITLQFDPKVRTLKPHPNITLALKENAEAKKVFDSFSPSRQKELIRYISFLKSEETITRNIDKLMGFFTGKNDYLGFVSPHKMPLSKAKIQKVDKK